MQSGFVAPKLDLLRFARNDDLNSVVASKQ
jgi:hypothetical protein